MPAYVYKCKSCEYTYEKRKKFSDEHDTDCPECGKAVRRVINSVGVVFKGSGFYVTDSRANNSAAPNGKSSTDTSTSKSEGESKSSTADAKPAPAATKESSSKTVAKTKTTESN